MSSQLSPPPSLNVHALEVDLFEEVARAGLPALDVVLDGAETLKAGPWTGLLLAFVRRPGQRAVGQPYHQASRAN